MSVVCICLYNYVLFCDVFTALYVLKLLKRNGSKNGMYTWFIFALIMFTLWFMYTLKVTDYIFLHAIRKFYETRSVI